MKDDSDGDKKQQINHIQNLYAFNLFCQKRFDDSMQVFAKLGTGESPDTWHYFFFSLLEHSRVQIFWKKLNWKDDWKTITVTTILCIIFIL